MAAEEQLEEVEFTAMRPVSRRRMIVRALVAPVVWLTAFVTVAIVIHRTSAIATALIITSISMVLSFAVLSVLRASRDRQRRRYADAR